MNRRIHCPDQILLLSHMSLPSECNIHITANCPIFVFVTKDLLRTIQKIAINNRSA
jgi:hypothetical protein